MGDKIEDGIRESECQQIVTQMSNYIRFGSSGEDKLLKISPGGANKRRGPEYGPRGPRNLQMKMQVLFVGINPGRGSFKGPLWAYLGPHLFDPFKVPLV